MPSRRGKGEIYCSESFVAVVDYELKDVYCDRESTVCKGGQGTLSIVERPFPAHLELGRRYVLKLEGGKETWCFFIQGVPAKDHAAAYSVVAGE